MNARYTLLRMLVLTSCLVLILGGPRAPRVRAHTADCVNMLETPNTACPSSCTSATFNYWYLAGTGFYYSDFNQTPCGGSKPGQTCSQEEEYNPPNWECATCCLSNGVRCDPKECNNGNPCCGDATCDTDQLRCCVEILGSCQYDSDCCDTPCISRECQFCVGLRMGCNTLAPNCCTAGALCENGKCCLPIGKACSGNPDCCSGHCADRYGECICVS